MKRNQQVFRAIASVSSALLLSSCQTLWDGVRSGWHQRVLATQFDSRFTEINCQTFNLPTSIPDPLCGYVTVPKLHAQPYEATLALPVVILPGRSAAAEPLVLEAGRVGQSAIATLAPAFGTGSPAAALRRDRDIILIGQRGTEFSRPYLNCPELDPVRVELLKSGSFANPQVRQQLETPAYQACQERLTEEGIDFEAYNTLEAAADVISVLDSLGFQKVNFYGASDGSLLAQVLMQEYPNRLQTVILDGTKPTTLDSRQYAAQAGTHSLRQVFANCLSDESCNRDYPNLETVFLQLVDRLNASPQTLAVPQEDAGDMPTALTGAVFTILIQDELSNPAFVAELPQHLYRAFQDGQYEWLNGAIATQLQSSGAEALSASAICAQRNAPQSQNPIIQSFFQPPFPQLEPAVQAENLSYCNVFNVATLPDSVYEPVTREIPTLILNGQYDNVSPLAFGVLVANQLPNAYVYNYPRLGHGALTVAFAAGETCPISMVEAFLKNPNRPPDETCIQDMLTTVQSPPRMEMASRGPHP